jgi:hypothetical protein
MTHASEVTISDGEIDAIVAEKWRLQQSGASGYDSWRQALAAFLAARVPDAPKTMPEPRAETVDDGYRCGVIDCRDAVLKGGV